MENIRIILQNRKEAANSGETLKRNDERASLIGFFTDKLNEEREGTKYKPLLYGVIAIRLAHLTLHDLYAFKSQALDLERRGYSFAKYFWGAIKPK